MLENLAGRVRKLIDDPNRISGNLPGITCAASLAHHKLLGFVDTLFLFDVDLTSVPDNHLTSLVSSVEGFVKISNVSDCDIVTILDSVKSEWLCISNSNRNQSLGCEETRALVRAMESRVERVFLCVGVTLDIREMIEYNGLGKCMYVEFNSRGMLTSTYLQLGTWATSKNWEVDNHILYHNYFSMQRS